MDRVLAPAPANGAALNVSTGAPSSPKSPCRVELLGAPQGEKGRKNSKPLLSPESYVLSPALTPSRPSRRHDRHGISSGTIRPSVTAFVNGRPDNKGEPGCRC